MVCDTGIKMQTNQQGTVLGHHVYTCIAPCWFFSGDSKMEKKIKQIAQFLFDNAEEISKWIDRKEIYRTVNVEFTNYWQGKIEIELSIYDEQTTHKYLRNEAIAIELFRELCSEIDRAVGIVEKIPQPKLREKL